MWFLQTRFYPFPCRHKPPVLKFASKVKYIKKWPKDLDIFFLFFFFITILHHLGVRRNITHLCMEEKIKKIHFRPDEGMFAPGSSIHTDLSQQLHLFISAVESVEFVMRRTRFKRCFMVKRQVLVWLTKDWWSSRSSEDSIVSKGLQTGTLYLPKPAHVSTCMLNVFICKLHKKRGGSLGGLGPVSLTMKLGHGLFHPSLPAVPLFPLPPFVILCHLAVCEEARMFKGEKNKTFFANKQISSSCLQLITLSNI